MQCDEFELRLNELLDDRIAIDEDAGLGRHARECPACRNLWSDYAAIFADPVRKTTAVVRPDFSLRVVQAAKVERGSGKTLRRVGIAAAIACAAAIVLVLLNVPRSEPVAASRSANIDLNLTEWQAELSEHVHRLNEGVYHHFAQQTSKLAGSFTQQELSLMKEMAAGFEPVGTTVTTAWKAIVRPGPAGNDRDKAAPTPSG